MQLITLVAALLILTAIGFYAGRDRALSAVGGVTRKLHSLPSHYGTYVALWAGLPVFVLLLAWLALEPFVIKQFIISALSPEHQALPGHQLDLLLNDVRNIALVVLDQDQEPTRGAGQPDGGVHDQLQQLIVVGGVVRDARRAAADQVPCSQLAR